VSKNEQHKSVLFNSCDVFNVSYPTHDYTVYRPIFDQRYASAATF